MTNAKTPQTYSFRKSDKLIILIGAAVALVLAVLSGIFGLPVLFTIAQSLISAVFAFVIAVTCVVAAHTNRLMVDLTNSIQSVERREEHGFTEVEKP